MNSVGGVSEDGKLCWDGSEWRQLSPDGYYFWDGAAWRAKASLVDSSAAEGSSDGDAIALATEASTDPDLPSPTSATADRLTVAGSIDSNTPTLTGLREVTPVAEPVATDVADLSSPSPPTTTSSAATRIAANGAVVSRNGWWYWDLYRWQPLIDNPPEKAPGLFGGERMRLLNVVRSHPNQGAIRKAGQALAEAFQRLGSLEEAEREVGGGENAHDVFLRIQATCPVDIVEAPRTFQGGVGLMPDEFLAKMAMNKLLSTDWLLLTTKRLIHVKGLTRPTVTMIYLTDIRSCTYQQPVGIGFGKVMVQTASGAGMEGLDRVLGAAALTNAIEMMAAWARPQTAGGWPAAVPQGTPVDIPNQLRELASLRDSGILTQEEFDSKKAELLRRI
jgi:hypothetical protein